MQDSRGGWRYPVVKMGRMGQSQCHSRNLHYEVEVLVEFIKFRLAVRDENNYLQDKGMLH